MINEQISFSSKFLCRCVLCLVWLKHSVAWYNNTPVIIAITFLLLVYGLCECAFSALTLLVGRQEGHRACKN